MIFPVSPKVAARLILALSKRARYRHVHQAADKHAPAFKKTLVKAFDAARKAIDTEKLTAALELKDEFGILHQVSIAIETMQNALREPLEELYLSIIGQAGTSAGKQVKKLTAKNLRAAAKDDPKIEWAFDKTNPHATEWAQKNAGDLIDGISKTTRDDIRELVEAAFEEQFTVADLAKEIADLIGDDARAETIARTETMRASNEGQLEAWDQAKEAGLLTGNEKKEWIVTPDDRLCPVCEPMDGVTVGLDELFDVDGDQIDGPPAHPNCRCTIGLSI